MVSLNILVPLVNAGILTILLKRIALAPDLLLLLITILVLSYVLNTDIVWLIEPSLLSYVICMLIMILRLVSNTISTAIAEFIGNSTICTNQFVTVSVNAYLNFGSVSRYTVLVPIYGQVYF